MTILETTASSWLFEKPLIPESSEFLKLMTPLNRILPRRAFAHLALVALASITGIPRTLAKSNRSHITRQLLSEIFSNKSAAKVIGKAYLNSTTRRQEIIDPIPPLMNTIRSHDHTEIRDALRHQIQGDFANGRIVTVNGWVLSKTEANLCALTAIS